MIRKEEIKSYQNISVNDFFYVIALILYITHNFIVTSNFIFLKNIFVGKIINPIVLILLTFSMVNRKVSTKNKFAISIFLVIVLIIVSRNSLDNKIPIIYAFIFVIASYKKNLKLIIRSIFITYTSLLLLSFTFSKLGIIENLEIYRPEDGKIRYSLGMTHPNTFYIYYFISISSFIYLQNKITLLKKIIILLVSYYFYYLTDSRTGFIMIILLLISVQLTVNLNFEKYKIFKYIILNLFSILTITSYSATVLFNNSAIFGFLDSILSHRITLMKKFYDMYGINMWGNFVKYKALENGIVSNQYMILDNTYMYLLIDMGLIFTIMLCILYYRLFKILISMKLNKELIIISIYMLFAFSERLTLLQYNFSILFFFYLINYKYKKIE